MRSLKILSEVVDRRTLHHIKTGVSSGTPIEIDSHPVVAHHGMRVRHPPGRGAFGMVKAMNHLKSPVMNVANHYGPFALFPAKRLRP